jgi:hypothetical protein
MTERVRHGGLFCAGELRHGQHIPNDRRQNSPND